MVNVKAYIEHLQGYLSLIPEIKHQVFVVNQTQLTDQMRNLGKDKFPLMLVVVPSAVAGSPDVDNVVEVNTGLIYILKKFEVNNYTNAKMIDDLDQTQDVIEKVKSQIIQDAHGECDLFGSLQPTGFNTDPEYDFMGCVGWSVSIDFQTT